MKTFMYFSFFFFLTFIAQAQKKEVTRGVELDQLIDTDSLEIGGHSDSLSRKIDTFNPTAKTLKDSLVFKTQISDSVLSKARLDNTVDSLSQNLEMPEQKVYALTDSLQQKLELNLSDSVKDLIPNEAPLLPVEGTSELDVDPFETVEGINRIEELGPIENIPEIQENVNKIGEAQNVSELNQLKDVSDQTQGLKASVPKKESISATIENEAKNLKGVKTLEEQRRALEGPLEGMEKFQGQEHYKEELISTGKEKVVDHFSGQSDKLKAAKDKLAGIKKKYREGVPSIKNLPKRRPNPMKGKSLRERLILGLTVQVHPDQIPNVDISPFAAYKISPRLSFGIGGSYRLMTREHFKGLTKKGTVYGYRAFMEFMVYKDFFVHADYEMLKTPVRDSIMIIATENIVERKWIDGMSMGIGKKYKIGQLVKGNVQVLYNFLHDIDSPYQNKVMIRFGFSFQVKDKVKRSDLSPEIKKNKEAIGIYFLPGGD